jgi:O-methyltransferase
MIRSSIDEFRFRKVYGKYKDYTMVPRSIYTGNLHLASTVMNTPGSIVECGTWRGGMIAGIADVLGEQRRYYLFDSFQGLPPAKENDGAAAVAWQSDTAGATYYQNCKASEADAREAMSRSAAQHYEIVAGWFNETLSKAELSEPIALLRMDADWYESTKSVLDGFADRMAPGGLIIVDDYYTWEGCTLAVNEFATLRRWKIRQSRRGGICFIVV